MVVVGLGERFEYGWVDFGGVVIGERVGGWGGEHGLSVIAW